jgi:hypothetical protein
MFLTRHESQKSDEVPKGQPLQNKLQPMEIQCSLEGDTSPQKSNEIPRGYPLQNVRELMEVESNPKGVRTYTFRNGCKCLHLVVAI